MPRMTDAKREKIRQAFTECLRHKLRLWDAESVMEKLLDQDLPDDHEWLSDLAAQFSDPSTAEATLEDVQDLLDDLTQKGRT